MVFVIVGVANKINKDVALAITKDVDLVNKNVETNPSDGRGIPWEQTLGYSLISPRITSIVQ